MSRSVPNFIPKGGAPCELCPVKVGAKEFTCIFGPNFGKKSADDYLGYTKRILTVDGAFDAQSKCLIKSSLKCEKKIFCTHPTEPIYRFLWSFGPTFMGKLKVTLTIATPCVAPKLTYQWAKFHPKLGRAKDTRTTLE